MKSLIPKLVEQIAKVVLVGFFFFLQVINFDHSVFVAYRFADCKFVHLQGGSLLQCGKTSIKQSKGLC